MDNPTLTALDGALAILVLPLPAKNQGTAAEAPYRFQKSRQGGAADSSLLFSGADIRWHCRRLPPSPKNRDQPTATGDSFSLQKIKIKAAPVAAPSPFQKVRHRLRRQLPLALKNQNKAALLESPSTSQ